MEVWNGGNGGEDYDMWDWDKNINLETELKKHMNYIGSSCDIENWREMSEEGFVICERFSFSFLETTQNKRWEMMFFMNTYYKVLELWSFTYSECIGNQNQIKSRGWENN